MKKNSIKIISLLVVITMSLTSCLHDLEDFMGEFSKTPAIAEIPEAANPATGTIVREIINPSVPANFVLKLNITAANYLSTDTKITVAIDTSMIGAYNTEHGLTGAAKAKAVPAAAISVASYDVIIPAGKREADWAFSVDALQVPNPTNTFYMIPVKITAVDNGVTISGNYNFKLIRILARNKYDGHYTATGTFVDYVTGPAWSGSYPKNINLITVSGDIVSKYDIDNGIFGYIFDTGAGLSYFGAWTPTFKFDASDNVIDVINSTPDAAPRSRSAALWTGAGAAANKMNADHSIDVSYNLVQQNVSPVIRSLVVEHYVYIGPR